MDFKLKYEQRTVLRTGLYWGIAYTGGWPENWHVLAGIASTPPKSWGRVWQFGVWNVKRGFKFFRIQGDLLMGG